MPGFAIYELTLQPVVAYSSQWQTATLVIIKMRTRVYRGTAVYTYMGTYSYQILNLVDGSVVRLFE